MNGRMRVADDLIVRKKVEQRAYELYLLGGCENAHELEHWLQAESEVLAQSLASSVPPKRETKKGKSALDNGKKPRREPQCN